MSPKDADEIANSEDPDQTVHDLILHCLPIPVTKSVQKIRIITVLFSIAYERQLENNYFPLISI